MEKQKKQNLLTIVITILLIALILMITSIVYEEKINMSKQPVQNTNSPVVENNEPEEESKNENLVEAPKQEEVEEPKTEETEKQEEQYVGKEENEKQDNTQKTTEEKAIDLVKKEWGDDSSVTFSIVKKNGNKYYVAVQNGSTQNIWYEVDIETWEVSEY